MSSYHASHIGISMKALVPICLRSCCLTGWTCQFIVTLLFCLSSTSVSRLKPRSIFVYHSSLIFSSFSLVVVREKIWIVTIVYLLFSWFVATALRLCGGRISMENVGAIAFCRTVDAFASLRRSRVSTSLNWPASTSVMSHLMSFLWFFGPSPLHLAYSSRTNANLYLLPSI